MRAGTEQGDSVEECVKSDSSSGRMGINVGAIAQTWDEPEGTERLQNLLWKVDIFSFIVTVS